MPNYFNALGSQTVSGTTGADAFYLFNKTTTPGDLRVDVFFTSFSWTTSLHLAGGASYVLTRANVNASADLILGDRFDAIYGSSGNDFVAYNNGTFNDGLGGFQGIQLMYLGAGDDIVDLSAHGPGGLAYGKDMKIYAGDGNDWIVGGAGGDLFYGEAGDDVIIGFAGNDNIQGGLGNDTIYGDDLGFDGVRSNDTLFGNEGNDTIYGGGRDDYIDGGTGDDILYGGWGRDTMLGGAGNDILYGGDDATDAADNMQGGAGNDQLYGIAGNDTMSGGDDNDLLDGGEGLDIVNGDAGNDMIIAGAGNDTINGGTGIDTVTFSGNRADYLLLINANGSVTLTDQRGGSPDGADTISNVEFFQFADQLLSAAQLNNPPAIVSNGGGPSAALSLAENALGPITTVQATDPDIGQTLTYRILGGADGARFAINGVTGVLTLVATVDFENPTDAGNDNVYEVLVGADDGAGGIDQQLLLVSITDVADGSAPVFVGGPSATATANENGTAAATVVATDLDNDPISYSIIGGIDGGLFSINSVTGVLTFNTAPNYEAPSDANQDNVYQIVISASDGVNSAFQTLAVSVANLNDNAPLVTSYAGAGLVMISLDENVSAAATITGSDADGSTLTYQIDGGDDAARFVINQDTGQLSFAVNPDYEVPLDANGDNIYNVSVSVSDGVASASQAFGITVRNVNDAAPIIVSNGGGATAAVTVLENSTLVTTVSASDADSPAVTYRIAGGADAAFFSINQTTGQLSFVAAPDFENPLDAGADNIYDVIVAASDGTFEDTQAIAVTIGNVNEPVFVGGPSATATANENGTAAATVVATDLDNDPISYSIIGGIDGGLFSINSVTGVLTFNTAPNYEAPSDANQDNVYQIVISASDGVNSAFQTLAVSVANLNDNAPLVTSYAGAGLVMISLDENVSAAATITGSDADGSTLTYQIDGGDDAARFVINQDTGQLSFAVNPDYEVPLDANGDNIYNVSVSVSDGVASASQAFGITVRNVNDAAPIIVSNGGGATAAVTVLENSTLVTTVSASDADSPAVTYRIAGGADAAFFSINQTTGQLSFVAAPDFERPLDAGANNIYDVIVAASDGTFEDTQAIAVTIGDVNEIGVTLTGNGANEIFSPTAAAAYRTTALNDTIFGNGGNDTIDGGAGADYMAGGIGNDTYYVDTWSDNAWTPDDDQVVEASGAGTDTVFASVSYRLTDNIETLRLQGSAALSAWGNVLGNTIVGNAGANYLDGGDGNDIITGNDGDDTIVGGAGADSLAGNAGNDWLQGGAAGDSLDGGAGADRMEGGADNDTYYVDTWSNDGNSTNDDIVVELVGGGTDTVLASVTYTLTDEVEKLTLTGSLAVNGTGNALGNTIAGNAANNQLFGLIGNDTIDGGAGNDIVDGGDGNDTLLGNTGNDTLYGGLNVDTIDGGTGDDWLYGGDSTDTLLGQAGIDMLIGGTGRDTMTGGSEADTFIFAFGDTSATSGFVDTITDFATASDKIDIDVFVGAPPSYAETAIASSLYADGLASAQALAAGGARSVFVAGSTIGWLFWDGNGDGSLDQAVILNGVNTLDGFAITNII